MAGMLSPLATIPMEPQDESSGESMAPSKGIQARKNDPIKGMPPVAGTLRVPVLSSATAHGVCLLHFSPFTQNRFDVQLVDKGRGSKAPPRAAFVGSSSHFSSIVA